MSTPWEGTTLIQGLRNKAPERGEGNVGNETGTGTYTLKRFITVLRCAWQVFRRDQQVQPAMTCGAVRVPMRRMSRVFPVLERCVGASRRAVDFVRTTADGRYQGSAGGLGADDVTIKSGLLGLYKFRARMQSVPPVMRRPGNNKRW